MATQTQTPPAEKCIDSLLVKCGPEQKQRWAQAFGAGNVSAKARELLDAAATQAPASKKAKP